MASLNFHGKGMILLTGDRRGFAGFLKKRAPIYLGLTGLFLVFAVPGLMTPEINDVMPGDLDGYEAGVYNSAMRYSGPDGDGLTMLEAVDMKLRDEFGDSVYKDMTVVVTATPDGAGDRLVVRFGSDDIDREYSWHVRDGGVEGLDSRSTAVVELVDFYD